MIEYSALPGETLFTACDKAVKIAGIAGQKVKIVHNNSTAFVHPTHAQQVAELFENSPKASL